MTGLTKVLVIQSETRTDAPYLTLTQRSLLEKAIPYLNSKMATHKQYYHYQFIHMKPHTYKNRHPAAGKLFLFREILENEYGEYDVLLFLDSDAWINNADYLIQTVQHLIDNKEKHGCFSRDPCKIENTYINSGSFLLKIDDYNRKMIHHVFTEFYKEDEKKYHTHWPYDQYYISKYIFENKDAYMVFRAEIMNTPFGLVLRHNWWKDNRMYIDLYNILENSFDYRQRANEPTLIFENELDRTDFPNKDNSGSEYRCI